MINMDKRAIYLDVHALGGRGVLLMSWSNILLWKVPKRFREMVTLLPFPDLLFEKFAMGMP